MVSLNRNALFWFKIGCALVNTDEHSRKIGKLFSRDIAEMLYPEASTCSLTAGDGLETSELFEVFFEAMEAEALPPFSRRNGEF